MGAKSWNYRGTDEVGHFRWILRRRHGFVWKSEYPKSITSFSHRSVHEHGVYLIFRPISIVHGLDPHLWRLDPYSWRVNRHYHRIWAKSFSLGSSANFGSPLTRFSVGLWGCLIGDEGLPLWALLYSVLAATDCRVIGWNFHHLKILKPKSSGSLVVLDWFGVGPIGPLIHSVRIYIPFRSHLRHLLPCDCFLCAYGLGCLRGCLRCTLWATLNGKSRFIKSQDRPSVVARVWGLFALGTETLKSLI